MSSRLGSIAPRAEAPDPPPTDLDEAEFRALFEANVRFVWRSLLGLGVGAGDVADASQQVFVVLHAHFGRWRQAAGGGGSARAYMYGICLRVASEHRRRAHRRHERPVADPPDLASAQATPEQRAASREELRLLDAALAQLTPAQREVFILFEIEELDMTEVARTVGCPLYTAYSRLRAARKAIEARLVAAPAEERRR